MRARLAQSLILLVIAAAIAAAHSAAGEVRSAALPSSLVGCWTRHVPALPIGTSAGYWLIRIRSNGAFAAYTPGSTKCDAKWDFTSHVSVAAGRLTIGSVPICAGKGVYAVKSTPASFVLRAVADGACAERARLLAGTWKRKR